MRNWINIITEGSTLCEKAIPETEYGYWITDAGDIYPVSYEAHDKTAKEHGTTYGHALHDGWIRIVSMRKHLDVNYHGGQIGRAAISSLQRLMSLNDYSNFKVDVRGRFDLHASYTEAAQVMRMVHATSKKAVERYNNEDWKWAISGGYFTKNLTEGREIPATRISVGGPVYRVATRQKLDTLLTRFGTLRAELFDNEMDVWDASLATHRAYEDAFFENGYRLVISKGSLEVNVFDFEDEDVIPELKTMPVINRIFPDLDQWNIGVNEI